MITKERVEELKSKYQKEVVYYETLGFDVLQGKFQEVVNFLNEIEEMINDAPNPIEEIVIQTEEATTEDRAEIKEEE